MEALFPACRPLKLKRSFADLFFASRNPFAHSIPHTETHLLLPDLDLLFLASASQLVYQLVPFYCSILSAYYLQARRAIATRSRVISTIDAPPEPRTAFSP
jgi:hypothetical protein